jgi:uncharacterized protein YndB with AHSA1/START domain
MNDRLFSHPILKTIEVNATQARVFETFVSRISEWWPLDKFARSRTEKPRSVVIEQFVGGSIYEVANNGDQLAWGRVTVFEPPSRLAMDWHLGRPIATEVRVEFEVVSATITRVRLTHSGWEKLEAVGATAERGGYEMGWALIFEQRFLSAASTKEDLR